MNELRKLARTQKRLKTLNKILCIVPILVALPIFIVGIINLPTFLTIILQIINLVWLGVMVSILSKLETVEETIAYEVEYNLYSAFREMFSDDAFEDELFGFVECIHQTQKHITVNVNIFNNEIDYKDLTNAVEPTINTLKRVLRKNVELYYVISRLGE